jgi:hypothetical protein
VAAGPPTRTDLSPDGKWRWDGSQWIEVSGTALAQVAAPQPIPPAYPSAVYVYVPRTNSLAVPSLVLGIMSWILCPFIGGVLAVIFGHSARGQIRRTGEGGAVPAAIGGRGELLALIG